MIALLVVVLHAARRQKRSRNLPKAVSRRQRRLSSCTHKNPLSFPDIVITKCASGEPIAKGENLTDTPAIDSQFIGLLRSQHHQLALFSAYNPEYKIRDEEICALGLDIGAPNAELTADDEAKFYVKTVENMREMLPKLRSVELRGFYVYSPEAVRSDDGNILRQFFVRFNPLVSFRILLGRLSTKRSFLSANFRLFSPHYAQQKLKSPLLATNRCFTSVTRRVFLVLRVFAFLRFEFSFYIAIVNCRIIHLAIMQM